MSRRTINNNVRLSQSDHKALKNLAEKSNLTIAEYLRKLVKADIALKNKKPTQYRRTLEFDVALVMATMMKFAQSQDEQVQELISSDADIIFEKIKDYMAQR